MKQYTKIPNELLNPSQLSIEARYLYCVLLKHCGQKEWCFPGQKLLAGILDKSERQLRNYLKELYIAGIVLKKRRGWNRSNSYRLSKSLKVDRKGISYQLGSTVPLHQGSPVPPKTTYLIGQDKRSNKGLEKLRDIMLQIGLKR